MKVNGYPWLRKKEMPMMACGHRASDNDNQGPYCFECRPAPRSYEVREDQENDESMALVDSMAGH
jgi:hypothetical protein